ncbi:CBS domain protein [Candidatus Xiphinematobacter sp. Idaho Grape]|uniref:CNNM domain-containing protein n=1 Tax=Candidatus Xiphinematobacter sp. Idaho Grape TaxID=1704307 RepID=UPI000705BECB|nr:CNNM domain-containing protein [Candidatus Xiphinematobacter sp. Idaho Grape]ALJ56437.1 CBS domain protein [Candidatus Xiphinematobacter sp. Idaho Grape]
MIFITIFACMFFSFTLSGVESTLNTNRARLHHYAKLGDATASTLRSLLVQRDCLLVTVITFSTLLRILTLALLYSFLAPRTGVLGAAAAITLSIPLLTLFLVKLPQILFQRLPISAAIAFVSVLSIFQRITWPLASLLTWLASPFVAYNKREQLSMQTLAATVEIGRAVSRLMEIGQLSHTAFQLVQNLLRCRNQRISSFIIPPQDVVHVGPDTLVPELLELSRHTGTEQILVLGEHKQIMGIVDVLDLLLEGIRVGKSKSHARNIASVSSTESIHTAIRKMRAAQSSICAVTAQISGDVLGVVTIDSLLQCLLIGKNRATSPGEAALSL